MLERIQTIFVVSLATVLIWLYAEGQNPAESAEMRILVRLEASDDSNLIVQQDSPVQIDLVVQGSTRAMRELQTSISGPLSLQLGQGMLTTAAGPHQVPMLDVLLAHTSFSGRDLLLQHVEPSVLEYTIDRWVSRVIEVLPEDPGVDIELLEPITCEPSAVELRIPESLLDGRSIEDLQVIAVPRQEALLNLRGGDINRIEADLQVPGVADSNAVRLSVERVTMTLAIGSTRIEMVKTSVPVHLVMTPLDQPRYDISLQEPIISELRLSGSQELIDQVNAGQYKITARVILTSDDLARGITQKVISFAHLPNGLRVESEELIAGLIITRRE